MRVCIYFGRFSHRTALPCQEVKNSGDKQSANRSLLGGKGQLKVELFLGAPENSTLSPVQLFQNPLSRLLLAAVLRCAFPARAPLPVPSIPQTCSRQPRLDLPALDGLML